MKYKIIKKLKEKIANIKEENSLIVLKGFETNYFGFEADLEKLFSLKPTKAWLNFCETQRNIISYEEFMVFYNFIKEEDYKIRIINNNLYHNFYPLCAEIPSQIKYQMSEFFDEDNISTIPIEKGDEYLKLYSNFRKIDESYFVTYNDSQEILNDINIEFINLFDEENISYSLAPKESCGAEDIILLQETQDYLYVLEKLENNIPITINLDSYVGNEDFIYKKLQIINDNIAEISIVKTDEAVNKIQSKPEFKELLKKYWGYDEFRKLSIYDFSSIKRGQKVISKVSQENIIGDIVAQVEGFYYNPNFNYRDIFVTAPTGSGKTLMFLVPAMYLAQKYNLVTLVISPLIGLMNDQVANIEKTTYKHAKTINSDMSQIEKEEIINELKDGKTHILYLSPESLLARSDISQLIGDRKIGMVVIDEAHIVTTWGKQFRPDYWYLGDYIKKLRKKQTKEAHPFLLATFTATAIYGGVEDMYKETLNSLSMHSPITYLGYVKRNDIDIKISEKETIKPREEYELDKFNSLIELIKRAELMNKKTLIYFPTVRLIEAFYRYCLSCFGVENITRYHGKLSADEKTESAQDFTNKTKLIMLATKAFGMGIDISDIEIVCHFAPTGNVCDYIQEIGRAARKKGLEGQALYHHMKNDFQHINRLHGLSAVKKYQLVEVIKKVYELFQVKMYENKLENKNMLLSKKRNEMLVDAENFTYIFEGPLESDESDLIAKVKTALLLIQKDYTNKIGYSPFTMRPATLFVKGFFQIQDDLIEKLQQYYGEKTFAPVNDKDKIYKVDLDYIWKKSYENKCSFPKFKYLLYTADKELEFLNLNKITPALCVQVDFAKDNSSTLILNAIANILKKSADNELYLSVETNKNVRNYSQNIASAIQNSARISAFRANSIANILISVIKNYNRNYRKSLNSALYKEKEFGKDEGSSIGQKSRYMFFRPIYDFVDWIFENRIYIRKNVQDGAMYLVLNGDKKPKEILVVLGLLEAIGYLKFKATGGVNSQIYIHVNQTKTMQEVINKPQYYKNELLDKVKERHLISVKMLSHMFQNKFSSSEIWELIENYFLGIIPDEVQESLQGT